jgi:hypothetical protein
MSEAWKEVWRELFGRSDTYTDNRIVFIFANVAFLVMSHMTHCSEMSEKRDTKTAVRKRVKRQALCDNSSFLSPQTKNYSENLGV